MNQPRAYEGGESYIFISYAHADSDRVLPVISGLQERGYRVWYDAGIEAGTEWPEYIAEHLDGCSCFLAFISEHSLNSHNCRREINFAIELRKEPLVVYLEDVQMSLGMRMQLGSLQAMFRNRHSSLESFLDELCASQVMAPSHGDAPPQLSCLQTSAAPTPNQEYYSSAPQQYPQSGAASPYQGMGGAAPNGMFYSAPMPGMFQMGMNTPYQNMMWGAPPAPTMMSQEQTFQIAMQTPNLEERVRIMRGLADQGYAPAISVLGLYYETGNGLPKDMQMAILYYQQAALMGDPDAYRWLADCYKEGKGVSADPDLYRTCLTKSAELGSCWAQLDLGKNYKDGSNGYPKNKTEALKWFRKAAAQSVFPNSIAQIELDSKGRTW